MRERCREGLGGDVQGYGSGSASLLPSVSIIICRKNIRPCHTLDTGRPAPKVAHVWLSNIVPSTGSGHGMLVSDATRFKQLRTQYLSIGTPL